MDEQKNLSTISTSSKTKKAPKTYTITIPSFRSPKFRAPKSTFGRYVLALFAFLLVGILSGFLGAWFEYHDSVGVASNSLSNQKQVVTSDSQLISEIAKTVGPSVVSINDVINTSGSTTGSSSTGLGLFGITAQPQQEQAAGTGIIISSNGLVMTNRHVVPVGTTKVSITLSNGVLLKNVSIVGRSSNPSLDIAFLKINNLEGQKLTPAVLGNSSQMQVGDAVVAIGNALGQFQNTVTSGIISGYGRNVTASSSVGGSSLFGSATNNGSSENLSDLFQTDAAINEGNSGGPLVNLNGQVIGINVAIAGNAQNIGFSIPINDVKGIINQILKTGKFSLPYLGIRYIPLTADVANEYHLSISHGAFIVPTNSTTQPSIAPNSPAQKAGLEANDIITAVNGTPINQSNSLDSLLYQYSVGTTIRLSVLRNNTEININVTLGATPGN
jgi:S1-C subfamily serine protease